MYGEGVSKKELADLCVAQEELESLISFEGNQSKEIIQKAYIDSHFVLLPSESEGWPKAIAEGMFWGCVPVATAVSCLPFMLDYGKRGVLLSMNIENDAKQVVDLIKNQKKYNCMQAEAAAWSRNYTVDLFEIEIKKLLKSSN